MTVRVPKNLPASVRVRLRDLARRRGEEFQLVLTRYALERLFFRIGASAYREAFVLKGAMLFALWGVEDYRATRDADFLLHGNPDPREIERIFREVCEVDVERDGIRFRADTVRAEPIREENDYGGVRVTLRASLDAADIAVQVDIGFGDVVTPPARWEAFPALLDFPAPRLRMYPRETVVAEKFEAMVRFGVTNSRMKDFYDIFMLAREFEFDGAILAEAIRSTFTRRGTIPLAGSLPAFSAGFYEDPQKIAQWRAFCARGQLRDPNRGLDEVCHLIDAFLTPLAQAARGGRSPRHWPPGGPWREKA